jgi:hypothetical protein
MLPDQVLSGDPLDATKFKHALAFARSVAQAHALPNLETPLPMLTLALEQLDERLHFGINTLCVLDLLRRMLTDDEVHLIVEAMPTSRRAARIDPVRPTGSWDTVLNLSLLAARICGQASSLLGIVNAAQSIVVNFNDRKEENK